MKEIYGLHMTTLTQYEHLNAASENDNDFTDKDWTLSDQMWTGCISSGENQQGLEVKMLTALEYELIEAGRKCEVALHRLYGLGLTRYLAADEYRDIVDELNYLLNDIDEISNLIVNAKNVVLESESIRAILIGKSMHSRSCGLIHLASIEQLNAGELRKVLIMRDKKVREAGEKLREYNSNVRILLEKRSAEIISRILMNLAGFPDPVNLPEPVNLQLLSELYDDQFYLQHYQITSDISYHP
ncbi:MAG: hypothetical protein IPM66_16040 [Acidobacteriota bacterium]|nr:MAG: hypothetical protein IPM66_16040 [Acidobacteriota bacterium]